MDVENECKMNKFLNNASDTNLDYQIVNFRDTWGYGFNVWVCRASMSIFVLFQRFQMTSHKNQICGIMLQIILKMIITF